MSSLARTSLLAALTLSICALPASGASATRGFAVTSFAPAIYTGDDACPEGFAEAPDIEGFLATLPAAERVRLTRPLNTIELVCEALGNSRPHPIFTTVKGRHAEGLDLDGSNGGSPASNTCA